MHWLRRLRARLFGFLFRREVEEGINEEIRFHIAARTEEYIAGGMSPGDAASAANRQFGNVLSVKDAWRDVSGGGVLDVLWQDLRFAARMLFRDRVFTIFAVLALALGIGVNTALFTILSDVILRPLPFPEPDRIMSIWSRDLGSPRNDRIPFSYPDFLDISGGNKTFSKIGGFRSSSFVVKGPFEDSVQMQGAVVTSEVFVALGATPEKGRIFDRSEDEPGNRSIILSHELWQERFQSSPDVLGAKLQIDGEEYSVVGVMPADFRFPIQNSPSQHLPNEPAQFWITFARDREAFPDGTPAVTTRRDTHFVYLVGRLKENVSAAAAEADVSRIAADLAARYSLTNAQFNACSVLPLLKDLTRSVRPALLMLVAASLCVLCVACVNVGNLLLARSKTRLKEIAIRMALGAGSQRILRQLLTESLLLAALGGSIGLGLAVWGTHYIVSLLPPSFPRLLEIAPDTRVLVFACVMTLITSCVFGFAPAWRSAHCDLAPILNDSSRGSSGTRRGRRTATFLVIVEMVLSFILLVGACSLLRGLWRLERAVPGINPHDLFTAGVSLSGGDLQDPRRIAEMYQELLAGVSQLPEVQAASVVYPLPFTSPGTVADFEIIGRSGPKPEWPRARPHAVGLNYFGTMEIPLLKGRDFGEQDRRDGLQVVIVNETLARRHFGLEDALGKKIRPGLSDTGVVVEREIIGIVGDVKSAGLAAEQRAEVYVPIAQCASSDMTLVVRSASSPEKLVSALSGVMKRLEGQPPLSRPSSMDRYLKADMVQPRLTSRLLGAFALVAVLLTVVGVYGVTAYSVAQRRHEIGIRLALGAQKLAVFQLVIRDGLRLVLWSVVGGGLITLYARRFVHTSIIVSSENELSVILFVTLFLSLIGFLACCVPVHRAVGEDPLAAIGQR